MSRDWWRELAEARADELAAYARLHGVVETATAMGLGVDAEGDRMTPTEALEMIQAALVRLEAELQAPRRVTRPAGLTEGGDS